ncbi:lipoprotein N-acyltransferase Lnb domain-containing protein [Winogradskyella haliclonae]|uniref:Membrane protein n=1 Tax=Winogradskyella haliclonae TaxID=2048558 RepID=A0ABQ2C1F5_9FLAO|nr:DUF4105 domain-containing protein [Winogradskyella haliclonae]GGI58021.1 membrane protein [Winogradskyella haliclonae]
MKLKLSVFTLLFFFNYNFSQQLQLSPQAEVSVLTFGPGTNLNDAFGHNAFRIKDRTQGLDVVYGYGGYDFEAPNFYLKFAQGKLNYLINRRKFSDIFQLYRYYDRTIDEQTLNFSQSQKQKLYNYLDNNYKPENRRYLYDFFYDNCATKIRDVANISANQSIRFSEIKGEEKKTFRTLIHEQVGINTWGSFGIDIALGSIIDKQATDKEYMFLPKYIFKSFENAQIDSKPLVKGTNTIYKSRHNTGYKTNSIFNPIVILLLVSALIIYLTYRDYKSKKRTKWLDVILFSITGIIGVMLLLLWFGTDHTATGYNYNLLWAFPINLFVVRQLLKKQTKNWFRAYLKFLIIMLALMTMHWLIGIQFFAIALLPLLIALLIRYVYLLHYYKTA